jgi:predicted deacylase
VTETAYGAAAPRIVEALDIASFPTETTSRAFVELVHDDLGRPTRVPVLVARGKKEGPTFAIAAAVHGNEINGIPVIHDLFARLQPKSLRGSVVGVVVANVPGYLMHQRDFDDGTDLNRIMPGKADGSEAEVYAHRLVDRVFSRVEYLVDLHTASFGRANSLYVRANIEDETTREMAFLMRPQIIVHKPPLDGTLRGALEDLGVPAVTVEIGDPHRFQRDYVRRTLVGLRAVLSRFELTSKRPIPTVEAPVVCSHSHWIHTDHGGLLEVSPGVAERVEKDQVVARLSNVFGDVIREYRAPSAGVVIGKTTNPIGQTGARILHLGIEQE